jgi:gas vesicle protein
MVKVGAMRKDRPIWDAQWVSPDRLSTEQEIVKEEVKKVKEEIKEEIKKVKEEVTDTNVFIKLIKMETKLMKNQRFIATQLPTRKERKQNESK